MIFDGFSDSSVNKITVLLTTDSFSDFRINRITVFPTTTVKYGYLNNHNATKIEIKSI